MCFWLFRSKKQSWDLETSPPARDLKEVVTSDRVHKPSEVTVVTVPLETTEPAPTPKIQPKIHVNDETEEVKNDPEPLEEVKPIPSPEIEPKTHSVNGIKDELPADEFFEVVEPNPSPEIHALNSSESELIVDDPEFFEVAEPLPSPEIQPKIHAVNNNENERISDLPQTSPEPDNNSDNPNLKSVTVEVHNSSSTGSISEGSGTGSVEEVVVGEHEYEDISLTQEACQDSGKHSRCNSISSTNSNVIVHDNSTHSPESGMSSASPSDLGHSEEENEKTKINHSHTLPHNNSNNRILKRVVSEPGGTGPPPPPPPPPAVEEAPPQVQIIQQVAPTQPPLPTPPQIPIPPIPSPPSSQTVNEESTQLPQLQRSSSNSSGNSESSTVEETRSTPGSPGAGPGGLYLGNKQKVLPFVPPKFPSSDPNALIKPSEYLRSLSGGKEAAEPPPPPPPPMANGAPPPPPPPANPLPTQETKVHQPLSGITSQELQSVQLKQTKHKATKTMSCPPRSLSGSGIAEQQLQAQKEDLIAELKKSRDITGIKKMKVERVKIEEKQEKEMVNELSKQYSIDNFVEKMPSKDAAGNPIPEWKRQMLAKKAAEKARKEKEEQMAREAEEKRLQSIPAWKRNLILSKKHEEKTVAPPPPTVDVSEEKKVAAETPENKENNQPEPPPQPVQTRVEHEPEDDAQIIPWRAQLRKTNSTLNLLE